MPYEKVINYIWNIVYAILWMGPKRKWAAKRLGRDADRKDQKLFFL